MKKHSIIALAAIFGASLLFSCSKETEMTKEENLPADEQEAENPSQGNNGDAVMVFSASLEDAVDTKTYITTPEPDGANEGKYVPKWNSSDKIKVNGVESAAGVRYPDFTTASFSFSEEVTGPFYAIAPSDGDRTWDAENTRFSVLVKGTGAPQKYRNYTDESSDDRGTNPTYDMSHAILAAYSENTTLQFQQLTSYFKLTFTKGAGVSEGTKIKTIYIRQGEAADTPNIAGTWRVTFDGKGVASIVPSTLTAIIAYNCMVNGGTATDGVAFGSPVIITLPSYNFSNGLIITVKDTEDHFQSFGIPAASSNLSTKKGTLITKTLTYNPQSGTINSVEDWEAFAAAVNAEVEDWDLYKWVGNGTVKLGADIEAASLTRITNFKYTFDGQDHSITRTGSTVPLFETISGEVKNLVLEGSMTKTTSETKLAPLAYTLAAGGKITSVTNRMNLTAGSVESGLSANCYLAGIVYEVRGGIIDGCHNNGTITANLNVSNNRQCRVAGIAADINNVEEDVQIKDCTNYGHLTINPVTTTSAKGINGGAIGGIVAWINSGSYVVSLNNCDNDESGIVEWTAAYPIDSESSQNIGIRRALCIGGIIGNAAPLDWSSNKYPMIAPDGTNGFNVSMSNCDNAGQVLGRAICYSGPVEYQNTIASNTREVSGKVYIGGLAGALVGNSATQASLSSCTNTGIVKSYDYATSGTDYASNQAGFNAILGGLIGWGGYVSITGCTSGGVLGQQIRPVFALGGVIGYGVRPFSISSTTVSITGYFFGGKMAKTSTDSSTSNITGNNYAYFVATPKSIASTNLDIIPDVSGSIISSCSVTGSISTCATQLFINTNSYVDATWTSQSSKSDENWVRGIGLQQKNAGVTIE